jgi:Domain of unknown function (DUF4157)
MQRLHRRDGKPQPGPPQARWKAPGPTLGTPAAAIPAVQRIVGNAALTALLTRPDRPAETPLVGTTLRMVVPTMQRTFGNAAVAWLLARSEPSADRHGATPANTAALQAAIEVPPALQPRDAAVEGVGDPASMEVSLAGGRTARVFEGPKARRAAARMGAYAYSWRGDVYLGSGVGQPGAPSREEALRHELAHARQAHRKGPSARTAALESEARADGDALAVDPELPLGLWFLIPIGIAAYILLRPNVANAPSPEDVAAGRLKPSVSELQVAGEALALFAVPGGVTGALGRAGYGVVASFALGGAASSLAFRGVQDIGAGQFSGVEAYVVDATTGAVIGIVVGGTFRALGGTLQAGPRQPLVHLTSEAGAAGIEAEGVLRGGQGIYGLPSSAAQQGRALRFLRSLIPGSRTARAVPVPGAAGPQFTRAVPVGPVSFYQWLAGVYRAPAGAISMGSGAFTAGGRVLGNLTGQFWPYGVDALIWLGAAAASPAAPGAEQRGLPSLGIPVVPYPVRDLLYGVPPPVTTRTDGPFIELPATQLGLDPEEVLAAARRGEDPLWQRWEQSPYEAAPYEAAPEVPPAIILVTPRE